MARTVILSALSPDQRWDSGLARFEAYRGLQSLFGWDAQIKSLGAYLGSLGVTRFVTAAPELFFTPTSRQIVGREIGLSAEDIARAVHIRVGSARYTRILRTIPNLLATVDAAWPEILAPGRHPLRAHNVAPHAISEVLDLGGAAAPLFRLDGSEIPRRPVPSGALRADLPPAVARSQAPLEPGDFRGLEIYSLGEFSSESWTGDNPRPSLAPRRLALAYNQRPEPACPLILLPWNLANPVHAAPDLAVKYLRAAGGRDEAGYVVLLPFNATAALRDQLGPLVEELRRQLSAMAPRAEELAVADHAELSVFVARVSDLSVVALLRRLGAVTWIDGEDPEAAFTAARLRACGMHGLVLRGAKREPAPGELPVFDEAATIEMRGEFGRLFYRTRRVSGRSMERLIAATASLSAIAAPASAPIKPDPAQDQDFLELIGLA